jgi:hypothetical protein
MTKHQAATARATVRVGVIESLTRQSLAARTANRAIALIEPDFDPVGPNIDYLDLPKSALKVSSQSLSPQELLTAHRTRPPREIWRSFRPCSTAQLLRPVWGGPELPQRRLPPLPLPHPLEIARLAFWNAPAALDGAV